MSDSYSPTIPGGFSNLQDMLTWLIEEHAAIEHDLTGRLPSQLKELHAAPSRIRNFMIVAADGTDWDPGSGQGIYTYYASAWHKLG